MVYRKHREDFKEEEMTMIVVDGCNLPICPDCIKEGRKYEFGETRKGYYHCKNLYKCSDGDMSQCHQVFKEKENE